MKVSTVSKENLKKRWVCEVCPGWEENPYMCEHLEKLVNYNPTGSGAIYTDNIEKFDVDVFTFFLPKGVADGSYERRFRRKIKKYGLSPIQVDILVMRFFYGMPLKEISEELNIVSARTVLNILNKTLKEIKERFKKHA